MGPRGQAVVDGLLARVPGLEFCEHDSDGFAMWIATRPGRLLCGFCYQAAQVLAENVVCAACGQPAGDPVLRDVDLEDGRAADLEDVWGVENPAGWGPAGLGGAQGVAGGAQGVAVISVIAVRAAL
jgi:hypothetical protein